MWIQKAYTNPVVKCSLKVVLFAVLFSRIPVDLYPTPFKVTLTFTPSIEDTETTVTMEMKTSAVKKRGGGTHTVAHSIWSLSNLDKHGNENVKNNWFYKQKTTLRGDHTF